MHVHVDKRHRHLWPTLLYRTYEVYLSFAATSNIQLLIYWWCTPWCDLYFAQSFAYGNNLYYQASVTSEAEQVTTTGQETYIFNGIPDWMYEGTRTVISWRVLSVLNAKNRRDVTTFFYLASTCVLDLYFRGRGWLRSWPLLLWWRSVLCLRQIQRYSSTSPIVAVLWW